MTTLDVSTSKQSTAQIAQDFKGSCAAKASPMKSPSCQNQNAIVGEMVLAYDSVVVVWS